MSLHEEIKRQQKLMGITENPHRIKAREFGEMTYDGKDAIAFEYRHKKIYLEPKGTHDGGVTSFYKYEIRQKNIPPFEVISIRGRIWMDSSIVSFWVYPTNQIELIKVIDDIYTESNEVRKVYPLPDFQIKYIEIPWNTQLNEPEKTWDSNSFAGSPNFKIINIENYDKYINAS